MRSNVSPFVARIGAMAVCGLVGSVAHAATVTVNCPDDPSTNATISAAVAASHAGGTVVVCPGIYAENVVVPLNGLSIIAAHDGSAKLMPGDATSPGIQLNASHDTIRGLSITGFATGIYVGSPDGHETIDHDFILQNGTGISFHDSFYNVVTHTRVLGNTGNGVLDYDDMPLVPGDTNHYDRDEITYNGQNGVFINTNVTEPCDRAEISDSVIDNNAADGVLLTGSSYVQVLKNRLSFNGMDGIEPVSSTDNIIADNDASGNGASAASCGPAENGGNCTGFRVHSNSTGNKLTDNEAFDNLVWDAQDNSTGTETAGTANLWTDDHCRAASPTGICTP